MNRSQKIRKTKVDFAKAQSRLSQEFDTMVAINRINNRNYQLIENFEQKKLYRQRRSARNYIIRLLKKKELEIN